MVSSISGLSTDVALFQIQSAELLHRSEPGNYARLVLAEEVMMG